MVMVNLGTRSGKVSIKVACRVRAGRTQGKHSPNNFPKTMQNFAYTWISSVMFVRNVLDVGNRQVFYV